MCSFCGTDYENPEEHDEDLDAEQSAAFSELVAAGYTKQELKSFLPEEFTDAELDTLIVKVLERTPEEIAYDEDFDANHVCTSDCRRIGCEKVGRNKR